MAKKSTVEKTDGKTKTQDIIKAAKDCLDKYQERESDNIDRAKEAILFRSGEQWPAAIKRDRENANQDGGPRPCPVMDKTNQYVRIVVNEMRQNKAAIKVRPVDDKADKEVAEVYTGIIRHIEDASEATVAYTTAGEQGIDGGFGYFRVITEYCDPASFEQDIRIKRIPNRFSVALGYHTEPDGADAQEGLVWEDMDIEQFKSTYPSAKTDGFEADDSWITDDTIRVAEYFRLEPYKQKIFLMPDGETWTEEELEESGLDKETALKSRTATMKRLKWYKMTGVETLMEKDLPGRFIPIIKVTGNELVMPDGKIRLSGMLEEAMDPQRVHNFAVASFIENVALAPRAPWLGYKGQFDTARNDFADANRRNITVLEADMVEVNGQAAPLPTRIPPPGIAPGWQQLISLTQNDIQGALGMYGPSIGAKSQEKSGVALREQKEQGSINTFQFQDNLSRSIQHCGRIILEWIPHYYDTERVARILGEDGSEDSAYLNPEQEQAVMMRTDKFGREIGKSYNLSVGKYDLSVSTGPSYTAKRQEAAENMIQFVQAKPELMQVVGDLLFKNLDFPGSDKISERLKALLPPPIQQMEQEQSESDLNQKMMALQQASQHLEQKAQALFAKEQELMAAQQQIAEAGNATSQEISKLESLKKDIDNSRKLLTAEEKIFAAEVRATEAEIKIQLLEREEGSEPAEFSEPKPESQPLTIYDSSTAQPMAALAQSLGSLSELIAQSNQLNAMNTETLAKLAENASRPKRVITDGQGNPIGIEPVSVN